MGGIVHGEPATASVADHFAPEEVALRPREVRFDWHSAPLHWIPGDPYGSHIVTALNLFLPVAERWFSRLLADAMEYVRDERLREEIIGFIGQESVHAKTHDDVLVNYVRRHGIEPDPFYRQLEWVAAQYDRRMAGASGRHRRKALASGTHALCAAEHFTGVLGHWALNNAWDDMGVDPTLCDLYRWHGAEEVEHRHVSYHVAKYFGMDFLAQAVAGVLVSVVFFTMLLRGTKFLIHEDPALPNLGYVRLLWKLRAAGRRGTIPTGGFMIRCGLRLLRPDYDPVDEGVTAQAVAYLATSPAARAVHG
ncbi:metal-dependent hydrolase [Mycobacterium aquaticum]|uniref:Metal-dependent hydrolase n=1 Tax=Mycobacterium aquaticum TaxID=1927124 RepID=A0A1X0AZ19_9MYCO|nr:metal-dependent hydrolase [Mycobacterium aquaticum]ORA35331.1 metal-dependent hydrolase [Mycobacterium aquaticum]